MGRYKVDSLDIELTVTAKQTAGSLNKIANALKKIKHEAGELGALITLRKELDKFSKIDLTPIASALDTIARSSKNARKNLEELYTGMTGANAIATPDLWSQGASPKNITGMGTQGLEVEYNSATVAAVELASAQTVLAESAVKVAGAEKAADEAAKALKATFSAKLITQTK